MTEPILPVRITVHRATYVIKHVDRHPKGWCGGINYGLRRIDIVKTHPPKEVMETFWHEVTHAVLHSMGHPLTRDEKFVTTFAKRLNGAIWSAEFK